MSCSSPSKRDLWVLMAEVATLPENRRKLVADKSLITPSMVERLEHEIDALADETSMPRDFLVPGESQLSAALDVARTVVRRAERVAVDLPLENSLVTQYLNRLSDLVWALARWAEGPTHLTARERQGVSMSRRARVSSIKEALSQPVVAIPVLFRDGVGAVSRAIPSNVGVWMSLAPCPRSGTRARG